MAETRGAAAKLSGSILAKDPDTIIGRLTSHSIFDVVREPSGSLARPDRRALTDVSETRFTFQGLSDASASLDPLARIRVVATQEDAATAVIPMTTAKDEYHNLFFSSLSNTYNARSRFSNGNLLALASFTSSSR